MSNSTSSDGGGKSKSGKPSKPYATFPLSPHASGCWCKKIRGKIHYFGRWGRRKNGKMERVAGDGWKQALELFQSQADDLYAGRVPRETAKEDELTVAAICNAFLTSKLLKLQSGTINARSFTEYRSTAERVVAFFGKNRPIDDIAPLEFEKLLADISSKYGVHRISGEVTRIKSIFKYSRKSDLVPFEFKKPSAADFRKHRASKAKRLFSAEEIRQLLDNASVPMRCMILLGINSAFGNSDVASLPSSALDLKNGWVEFPRPKTGIERRCKLWPETISAIQAVLDVRPKPLDEANSDLLFITRFGNAWVEESASWKETEDGTKTIDKLKKKNAVGQSFGNLMRKLKINSREGLGFYSLRHSFRTVADGSKDFPACRLIMGHVDGSIDAVYREEISDERLVAVSDYVRLWLCGDIVKDLETILKQPEGGSPFLDKTKGVGIDDTGYWLSQEVKLPPGMTPEGGSPLTNDGCEDDSGLFGKIESPEQLDKFTEGGEV